MVSIRKNYKPIVVIVGPTASGKSDTAQIVAEAIDAEIISADALQVYKNMNIGTGKLSQTEMKVKHYGIDLVEPSMTYSVSKFQSYARHCITEIQTEGKSAILTGGTGFYVRSVIDDYDYAEVSDSSTKYRSEIQKITQNMTNREAWDYLFEKDDLSAREIEVNDRKRVLRALELNFTGQSYFKNKQNLKKISQVIDAIIIGISVDREILADSISRRVDKMIEAGLLEEVKSLLDEGFRDSLTASNAIGYKELVDYLDGNAALEQAITDIKTHTRRYAKRQRTWFRADSRIQWIDGNSRNPQIIAKNALEIIRSSTLYSSL